jgi:hypothetical protein
LGTRNPSDEPARTTPDDPNEQADERVERRRRRAHEAGLQKLVRKLATRPGADEER